jgi:hypothetical protein
VQGSFDESSDIDVLDGAILLGMGQVVARMNEVFGANGIRLSVGAFTFTMTAPEHDPDDDFEIRLNKVIDGCRIAADAVGVDYQIVVAAMLAFDDWTWDDHVFRSPVWMNRLVEMPIADAREIKGLEWLCGTSLAIRSKLCMVRESLSK